MAHLISKLAVAAVIATSLPAAALAHGGERDRDRPIAAAPAHPASPAAPGWRGREHEGPDRGRKSAWRDAERHRIAGALRALDAEHARLHARFAHHPRRLARYDRAYLERRAELQRRWWELSRHA